MYLIKFTNMHLDQQEGCDTTRYNGEKDSNGTSWTAAQDIHGHSNSFYATFDTTDLVPGHYYDVCVDMDGSKPYNAFQT